MYKEKHGMKRYVFSAIAMMSSTMAVTAHAEPPGTNMATPPPPAGTDSPPYTTTTSPAASIGTIAPEPVIDTKTTTHTFPNRPLLVTGLVLLGGTYGASAIVAATSDRAADENLYYPVVGPWMDLDERNCDVNACPNKTVNQVLLVGDGVLQGLGALSVLMSLFVPEKTTRRWYLVGNESVTIAPQIGNTAGLVAAGRF